VLDFSAYDARTTRDATTLLRRKTNIYVHISTDSVYDVCELPDTGRPVGETPGGETPEDNWRDTLGPGPVREEDAVRPEDKGLRDLLSTHHDYGHRKLEAEEQLVIQRRSNHTDGRPGIPYVILRLPDVLGPRDTTYRSDRL